MDLMVNPVITGFRQDVDGTIKELKIGSNKEDAYANIIGQAEGADLDNNKTKTINVSTYTEPVEILPTSGKDGMKKATVTLSNIPSGSATAYYWTNETGTISYYTDFDKSPATQEELNSKKYLSFTGVVPFHIYSMSGEIGDYQKISDTEFSGTWDGDPITFHRYPTYDITLWEISS